MRWILGLMMVGLVVPAARAQGAADEAAVRAVLARERDGWDHFNAEEVLSTYAPEVIWQNPFGVRLHGSAEVKAFLTDLLARPGYRAGSAVVPEKILDLRFTSPTTAAVWSDEQITGLVNDYSGKPMQPRHSYYLHVLVKKDGVWKTSDFLVMDRVHPA